MKPKRQAGLQARRRRSPSATWSDKTLVRACLRGSEEAWSALIDKYKNLIYSVPVRYGASQEDAADIFQAVCLQLFSELPNIRDVAALRSWLITVAARKYFHWKRSEMKQAGAEAYAESRESKVIPPAAIEQFDEEQRIREAIALLPQRCQQMVQLLFYEEPGLPYSEVAARLGLATGSVGFIRRRCLQRLQRILEEICLPRRPS